MHQPAAPHHARQRTHAAENQPPSLKRYRTAESHAAGSAPALWFQAMTGDAWDPPTPHSYEVAKKRHRRMLDDEYSQKEGEREREKKRDRERDPRRALNGLLLMNSA